MPCSAYSELSNRFRESTDPMSLQKSTRNARSGSFWTALFAVTLILLAFRSVWVLPWFALLIALPGRSSLEGVLESRAKRGCR